jgi:Nif-specific regulatory protein
VPATLEEVERRHVMATLTATAGNKTKAAAILGIERSTLDRKLARWAD